MKRLTWSNIFAAADGKGCSEQELKAKDTARYEVDGFAKDHGLDDPENEECPEAEVESICDQYHIFFNEDGHMIDNDKDDSLIDEEEPNASIYELAGIIQFEGLTKEQFLEAFEKSGIKSCFEILPGSENTVKVYDGPIKAEEIEKELTWLEYYAKSHDIEVNGDIVYYDVENLGVTGHYCFENSDWFDMNQHDFYLHTQTEDDVLEVVKQWKAEGRDLKHFLSSVEIYLGILHVLDEKEESS